MKDNFFIKIETWHKPDLGTQENVSKSAVLSSNLNILCFYPFLTVLFVFVQVHKLDNSTWQNVSVVPIDIADRSQVSAAVSRNYSGTFPVQGRNSFAPSCGQARSLTSYLPNPIHLT